MCVHVYIVLVCLCGYFLSKRGGRWDSVEWKNWDQGENERGEESKTLLICR